MKSYTEDELEGWLAKIDQVNTKVNFNYALIIHYRSKISLMEMLIWTKWHLMKRRKLRWSNHVSMSKSAKGSSSYRKGDQGKATRGAMCDSADPASQSS